MKILGPYKAKDGRYRVIVDGNTISYPKFLMEQHLGRKLLKDETVHHIDHNPLNNDLSNLQIISRIEHSRLHSSPETNVYLNCENKYGKEEYRRMLSKRGMGNLNGQGNKGKPKSEEHKRKISEALIGRKHSEETKKKMKKSKKQWASGGTVDT